MKFVSFITCLCNQAVILRKDTFFYGLFGKKFYFTLFFFIYNVMKGCFFVKILYLALKVSRFLADIHKKVYLCNVI